MKREYVISIQDIDLDASLFKFICTFFYIFLHAYFSTCILKFDEIYNDKMRNFIIKAYTKLTTIISVLEVELGVMKT